VLSQCLICFIRFFAPKNGRRDQDLRRKPSRIKPNSQPGTRTNVHEIWPRLRLLGRPPAVRFCLRHNGGREGRERRDRRVGRHQGGWAANPSRDLPHEVHGQGRRRRRRPEPVPQPEPKPLPQTGLAIQEPWQARLALALTRASLMDRFHKGRGPGHAFVHRVTACHRLCRHGPHPALSPGPVSANGCVLPSSAADEVQDRPWAGAFEV